MPFEIPKHAIPAFFKMLEKEDLVDNVRVFGLYMDHLGFRREEPALFSAHNKMHESGYNEHSSIIDAYQWRTELLADLFKDGFIIEYKVAERLVVTTTKDEYIVALESIGRYREWCWIDQGDTKPFFIFEPGRVLEYLNNYIHFNK